MFLAQVASKLSKSPASSGTSRRLPPVSGSSDTAPASGYTVIRLPVGWNGRKHLTTNRFVLFGLRDRMRITDIGEPRIIAAGDVLMMEDTTGAGHFTEVVSDEPFDAVRFALPAISDRDPSRSSDAGAMSGSLP
jgi:hypothetical protein